MSSPKGAADFKKITASLKRCPETKHEFFSKLYSRLRKGVSNY